MKRTILILLTAAALLAGGGATAQAVAGPAPAAAATVQQAPTPGTTLAQRNAYVKYVAGVTEVSPTLRIRLLAMGFRACEGITAHVPSVTLVAGLKAQYHLTSSEAWRVFYGAGRYLCPAAR